MKRLDGDFRFFVTLDFVSGYIQTHLAPESMKLTSFITPFGKYCYRVLPQGFADSGDQFNLVTVPLIENITRILKSIIEISYQARTIREAYDALSLLLIRIINLHMCVSLKNNCDLCFC